MRVMVPRRSLPDCRCDNSAHRDRSRWHVLRRPPHAGGPYRRRAQRAAVARRRVDRPLERRIYDFAEALLVVKELEYYGETRQGRLPERIRAFGDFLLDQVEQRHELDQADKSIPERIKAARKLIMEKLNEMLKKLLNQFADNKETKKRFNNCEKNVKT